MRQIIEYQDLLYKIYFVTGAAFLGFTLFIYSIILRRRKSIFDSVLCGHVASLFVCYTAMALDKIINPMWLSWCCKLTAYLIQFSFVASTLWLNAMCLCIFNSFRGYNCVYRAGRNTNKFLVYSAYVWGGAAIVSTVTFVAENTNHLPTNFKPQIGKQLCWIRSGLPQLLYFYLPIAFILSSNLCIFFFTLKKIFELQKKSNIFCDRDSKKHVGNNEVSSKKFGFTLYVRLFSLMGITWIFEIVSWIIGGPDYYWYLPDAINALRGVFVFIICCCKREVFLLIFKRSSANSNMNRRISQTRILSSERRSTLIPMIIFNNSIETSAQESI